jgi:hypothetical protein
MSDSFTSSSYYYSSTTNGNNGRSTTGHRYSTTSHTQGDGTTIVRTAQQELGQPAVVEERHYDNTGQEQLALPGPGASSAGGVRRIIDLETEPNDSAAATPILAGVSGPEAQLLDGGEEDDSIDVVSAPLGSRLYDPVTGAYYEHTDYGVDGVTTHHHEVRDAGGRRFRRDLDFDADGLSSSARENRVYEDPSTGTRLRKESNIDVNEVI